jgi:hypothetical protein
MKSFVVLCTLLIPALAGCSLWEEKPAPRPDDLALACEVTRCECRAPQSAWSFRDNPGKPVLWRTDGSAYCADGLALTRLSP